MSIYKDDLYQVEGKLEKNLVGVFKLLAKGERVTMRSVAELFDMELNTAGNKLKKLFDAHLVMRRKEHVDNCDAYEYYLPAFSEKK